MVDLGPDSQCLDHILILYYRQNVKVEIGLNCHKKKDYLLGINNPKQFCQQRCYYDFFIQTFAHFARLSTKMKARKFSLAMHLQDSMILKTTFYNFTSRAKLNVGWLAHLRDFDSFRFLFFLAQGVSAQVPILIMGGDVMSTTSHGCHSAPCIFNPAKNT